MTASSLKSTSITAILETDQSIAVLAVTQEEEEVVPFKFKSRPT
jgi:hypothetical protein